MLRIVVPAVRCVAGSGGNACGTRLSAAAGFALVFAWSAAGRAQPAQAPPAAATTKPPQASGAPAPAPAPAAPEPAKAPAAEEDETGKMGGEYRRINRHNFITPMIAQSAITNSSLQFAQGGGALLFQGPNILTGETQAAQIFLYGQKLKIQIGFVNRVAVDLSFGGLAAVGGDVDTLLLLGAITNLNVGGMPRVRLFTLENVGLQVSVGVGAYYDRYITIAPFDAIKGIYDQMASWGTDILAGGDVKMPKLDPEKLADKLFQQAEQLSLAPALMIAEGVGPFGAQLSVGPSIGVAGATTSTVLTTALHLTFDFRNVSPVPLALVGEYGLDFDFTSSAAGHTFGPGLLYSGRRDFEAGVVAYVQPDTAGQTLVLGLMTMSYFF